MAETARAGRGLKDETPGAGTPRASDQNVKRETSDMKDTTTKSAEVIQLRPAECIAVQKGRPVTTSLQVAEVFGKQHRDVLKRLQMIDCSDDFNERNFAPIEYTDSRNRKKPAYQMTKDGFTFLVMGFTGKKAAQFKEAYINAFNAMEKALHPDTLTEGQKGHIVQRVKEMVGESGKHFQTIYHAINEQFGVATYKDIPAARYPELCGYLETAPLEGEWMPAQKEGLADGVSLNDLGAVVEHMRYIDQYWNELGPALRALGSPYAARLNDHVRDGAIFAGSLKRKHGDAIEHEFERIRNIVA